MVTLCNSVISLFAKGRDQILQCMYRSGAIVLLTRRAKQTPSQKFAIGIAIWQPWLCYLLEPRRLLRGPVGGRVIVVGSPPLAAAPEDELAAAAGLVLVVRLLAARVERLPRPVQLYHQGNLQ